MVSRLPEVGGDKGSWGQILNDFLLQAHSSDGALKDDSVSTNTLQDASVTPAKLSGILLSGTAAPTNPATGLLYVQTSSSSTTLYTNVNGLWWEIGGGRVGAGAGGLVAAYSFDEGSGTIANDASDDGNDLTISGTSPWATGHTATGLSGLGGVQGVASFALGGSGSWTIMAWVYMDSVPTNLGANIVYSSVQEYSLLWISTSGNVSTDARGGYNFAYVLPTNTWTHLAIVVTSSTTSLYVNGTAYSTDGGGYWNNTAIVDWTILGASTRTNDGGALQAFAGTIDDLRFYNSALSDTDIATEMNTPVS